MRFVNRSAAASRALYPLALLAAAGCGAKTGLWGPDLPEMDATDVADVRDEDVIEEDAICLDPPQDAQLPLLRVDLSIAPHVRVADVVFVIDRTGSMQDEIENIRTTLRTVIVPGLIQAIPDLRLGVVTYGDFPILPYGDPSRDTAYTLEHPLTSDFAGLQGTIANIEVGDGGDNPEAFVEALYQTVTGEGLAPNIAPAPGCTSVGTGYACFRHNAEPVIVAVNDAPSHNGPGGSQPYARSAFEPRPLPHTYEQMITALNADLRPHVIGINSGYSPFWGRGDLEQVARDTSTVGADGQPLVFDIGSDGAGLGQQVVDAIRQFQNEVKLDVSARALDIDGSGGADLIRAVHPRTAMPASQIERQDDTTFYGVVPGTNLTFDLEIDRSRVMPTDVEQHFTVRVQFFDHGRPTLGYQDVDFVIPSLSAMMCGAEAGVVGDATSGSEGGLDGG